MKSKSTIKCLTSINNSRNNTQDFKSINAINSTKKWAHILEGLHAISTKIKQISGQQSKDRTISKNRSKCIIDKSKVRIDTTYDCSRQKSNKKYTRDTLYRKNTKSARNEQQQTSIRSKSSRKLQRLLTSTSQNQQTQKLFKNNNNSNDIIQNIQIIPKCQNKCHYIYKQINQLKRVNENLIKKNYELEKKIIQNQKQEISRTKQIQKSHRNANNQLVLKIVNHDLQNSQLSKYMNLNQAQTISIQIKPFESFNVQKQNKCPYTSPLKVKNSNQYPQYISKALDPYIPRAKKQQSTQILKQSATNITQNKQNKQNQKIRKTNTNDIKSLQTQFDRLMQMSYLQRNKAKKRIIWNQMKSIASQLKMMRNFTQL